MAIHIPVKDANSQRKKHCKDDIEAGHVRVTVQVLPGELSEDVVHKDCRSKEEVLFRLEVGK